MGKPNRAQRREAAQAKNRLAVESSPADPERVITATKSNRAADSTSANTLARIEPGPPKAPAPVDTPIDNKSTQPDWQLFTAIFGLGLAFFVPLLQANGVSVNWIASLVGYVLILAVCEWTLMRHALPHKDKRYKWGGGLLLLVSMGALDSYAILQQFRHDNPPAKILIDQGKSLPVAIPTATERANEIAKTQSNHPVAEGKQETKSSKSYPAPLSLDNSRMQVESVKAGMQDPRDPRPDEPAKFMNIWYGNHGAIEAYKSTYESNFLFSESVIPRKDVLEAQDKLLAKLKLSPFVEIEFDPKSMQDGPGSAWFSLPGKNDAEVFNSAFNSILAKKGILYVYTALKFKDRNMLPSEVGVSESCAAFDGNILIVHSCGRIKSFVVPWDKAK